MRSRLTLGFVCLVLLVSMVGPADGAARSGVRASVSASALPTPGANSWFFAEGNTLSGWFEYITVVNPDPSAALDVSVEYALEVVPGVAAPPQSTTVNVPAGQRRTIEVFNQAGGGVGRNAPAPQAPGAGYTGVAAKLTAARPFIAERPMYLVNGFDIGLVNGAHNALGVTAESLTWQFAEGSTLPGFQPFFTLQNARDVPSNVTITYATEAPDATITRTLTLAAKSRTTIDIAKASSPGGLGSVATGFGTTISASSPIVAERPFYVNRDIGGIGVINGAHDEHGATAPSTQWTFAEGTALPDFFEFLTLYNPSTLDTNVEITYQLDGISAPQVRLLTVGARRRATVQVYNDASPGGLGRTLALATNPTSGGISASLRSTNGVPFLAERPMYVAGHDFGGGAVNGAHDVFGQPGPGAPQWTFAEGTVRPGFFEFLTLQNPNPLPVAVRIDYLVNGGPTVSRNLTLTATSRTTVVVFGSPAQGGYAPPAEATSSDIGLRVTAVNETSLIVAERPMYILRNFEGVLINDAHNTLGLPTGAPPTLTGPAVNITSSDTTGLTLHIDLPDPIFFPISGGGINFTGMTMPGLGTFPGTESPDVGKPAVPELGVNFAVPQGTTGLSMQLLGSTSSQIDNINLAPAQPDPSDANFGRPNGTNFNDNFFVPPFQYNFSAYSVDAKFPASPATTQVQGELRDLNAGRLDLFGAQYNPVRDQLTVFKSFDVRINFGPNSGIFGPYSVKDVWELPYQKLYSSIFVNWATVVGNLGPFFPSPFCGEELLILTGPSDWPAANRLANFREVTSGIQTRVRTVGSGPGEVPNNLTSIRDFIRSEVTNPSCYIHPSYVLLMGDVNEITTSITDFAWASGVATDLFYALKDNADFLPDLAVGRIPTSTLAVADVIVDKITGYESNPPTDPDFYNHTFNASYFEGDGTQDQRPYINVSEKVHDALTSLGFVDDRIYTLNGPSVNPLTDVYGTPYPGPILRSNGFQWSGSTTDVTQSINAGRFLSFQRDHGYDNGWWRPQLDVANIPALTNGNKLTVSFSINCSSGYFDDPTGTQHHAEQFLSRVGGGAVGVIAASRVSPTYQNNNFTLGLYDALFPTVLPTYGTTTALRRMGDVMNYGKIYTSTTDGATAINLALYNYFGDPTMQIHVRTPRKFDPRDFIFERLADRIRVRWGRPDPPPEGALVTLLQPFVRTQNLVGRGILVNGVADIMDGGQTKGVVQASFDREDFLPAVQRVTL